MNAQYKRDLMRRLWWKDADGTLKIDDIPCQFDRGLIYFNVAELAKRAGPDGMVAFDHHGISYDKLHAAAEKIAGHFIRWPEAHPDLALPDVDYKSIEDLKKRRSAMIERLKAIQQGSPSYETAAADCEAEIKRLNSEILAKMIWRGQPRAA